MSGTYQVLDITHEVPVVLGTSLLAPKTQARTVHQPHSTTSTCTCRSKFKFDASRQHDYVGSDSTKISKRDAAHKGVLKTRV